MQYNNLEYFVSQPRLNRFLTAAEGSKSKAQNLYRVNLRVSQAFYPVLNLFEIFLRNVVHYQISAHFANPNWIIKEKNGFMGDSSLAPSKFFLKTSVQKAERTIKRKGGTVTAGKLIAEQSLGFWTSLFDTHHYRLIGGSVIHCFPHKPPLENRKSINQRLNKIREFRNRVYHNEPICFGAKDEINFKTAVKIKSEIYQTLDWIDPNLIRYVDYFNGIDAKINAAINTLETD